MEAATWISDLGLDSLVEAGRLIGKDAAVYTRPYGMEMMRGLENGVDAYLVEQEKPVAAFVAEENEQEAERRLLMLGDKLWNQGLANVLLLYLPGKVKIYSLLDKDSSNDLLPYCINVIDKHIKEMTHIRLQEIEEGIFFRTYAKHFEQINRVDKSLLENLKKARIELTTGKYPLSQSVAQALLLQILFIAYLEDRRIVPEADFLSATQGAYHSLSALLAAGNIRALEHLFESMRKQFNGDMFLAPGIFAPPESSAAIPVLYEKHLRCLHGLRSGNRNATGQFTLFRLYNFEYIPISLLSAIYDHFQSEPQLPQEKKQRKADTVKRSSGSYFTPAHLAQTCVSLAWKHLPKDISQRNDFYVLDPACGSAVFLVCVFQRLAGYGLRKHSDRWQCLKEILLRLHGCDREESALGVGIVSLYIALLEYMEPPALSALRSQGKILPQLLNETMRAKNFFEFANPPSIYTQRYDLIIGNPPWLSRQGKKKDPNTTNWEGAKDFLFPGQSPTWGFIWKSTFLLKKNGIIALLINAGHIFSTTARNAMRLFYKKFRVYTVVNFADACFQLFDGAQAPAALIVYGDKNFAAQHASKMVEFCSPKANPDYYTDRRVVLAADDVALVSQNKLAAHPEQLIAYKWANSRDRALMEDLKQLFPILGRRIIRYKQDRNIKSGKLLIGQGLYTGTIPLPHGLTDFLFINADKDALKWVPLASDIQKFSELDYTGIDSLRFIKPILEQHVVAPFILIAQGVSRKNGQLRAGYTEQPLIFTKSLQGIASPSGMANPTMFKILTAVLNSRLAAWFFLHAGSVSGIERAKVHLEELLLLPFPLPEESPNPTAGQALVSLMDAFATERKQEAEAAYQLKQGKIVFPFKADEAAMERKVSELVYQYYGLTDSERQIVEDTHAYILPSLQPKLNGRTYPKLWDFPDSAMLEKYGSTLQGALASNYKKPTNIKVTIYAGAATPLNVAVMELHAGSMCTVNIVDSCLQQELRQLENAWPEKFAEGVHSLAHIIFAEGSRLMLIKPNRIRHWMPSAALCDADRILADLRKPSSGINV